MKTTYLYFLIFVLTVISCRPAFEEQAVRTEIAKWHGGKKGAVSLTFDDGTIHQFTVAMPIMDSLDMLGTFYIITGKVPGSQYRGQFIGRPCDEIIAETATIATNKDNLFERASAIGFLGYEGGLDYHTRAGSAVDAGNMDRAIEIIDEGYAKIRSGALKKVEQSGYIDGADTTTWEQYRQYADKGHEIGSHTITHPRLAILDETNLLYELQKSREEILDKLGQDYIFTMECPYGTENERVMEYAYEEYEALRNRMPEPFLHELNRWDTLTPGETNNEYVQWQRGPLSKTPMDLMKSWVDTVANRDNAWLVLVFHGVEGVGWEARTKEDLREYYEYIASKRDQLWVAPFRNVTQYVRERMDARVQTNIDDDAIVVSLTHSLNPAWYNHTLTLKTLVPDNWSAIVVQQGDQQLESTMIEEEGERFIMYSAMPNSGEIRITNKN